MELYTNIELLKGIIEQNQDVLNYLYQSLFPKVNKMILKQGGDYDTANDIFQETIITIYKRAKNGTLTLPNRVENYIMTSCKVIWFKHYARRVKRKVNLADEHFDEIDDYEGILEQYKQNLRMKLFYEHFKRLNTDCQKVLKAFFAGTNFAEMAEKLGLGSEEYARRKKYLCKEALVKSIKNDPEFSKLIGDYDEELFEID